MCQSVRAAVASHPSSAAVQRAQRNESCPVLSAPFGDAQSRAQTGHLPSSTRPPPVLSPVALAVKCNSSLCGIKTAFTHKQRRSGNKDTRRGTGAASGRGGKSSASQLPTLMFAGFVCQAGVETGACLVMNE